MLDELKDKWSMDYTKPVILYFISIIMYIISFVHLFKKGASEYIAYVFVFIINAVSPFIWLSDYRNLVYSNFGGPSHVYENGKGQLGNLLMQYRSFGIYIASAIQFIALFLVLLKNEDVRKLNKFNSDKSETDTKYLNTTNKETEKHDKSILAIFVTIVTTLWALVGHTFSLPTEEDNNVSLFENVLYLQKDSLKSPTMGFVNNIRLLLSLPLKFINGIEEKWLEQMNRIQTTPLVKSFSFYCMSFIIFFFGVFVRIPRQYWKFKGTDRFNIINMETPFPRRFDRNVDQYRNLSLFVLSGLLCLVFACIMYFLNSFLQLSNTLLQLILTTVTAIIFGSMFGKSKEILPDATSVKSLIFFFLCIVFSLLGTPVVLGVLQLFTEIGLFERPIKLFVNMFNMQISSAKTLNVGSLLTVLFSLIFVFLLFFMFGFGMKQDWIGNHNGKPMQMFNVVMVCMALSLFIGLSTSYPVSNLLYNSIKNIMEIVLVFIAPIAIVVLSVVQFLFAFKNQEKYQKTSKVIRKTNKTKET
jgi:hypothetical protein